MNPTLTTQMQEAIRADSGVWFRMLEIAFDTATARVTDAYRDIVWNGETWTAFGHLLSFEGAEINMNMDLAALKVVLSGVSQEWVAILLNEQYVNRRAVLWEGSMEDAVFTIIPDPYIIWSGRVDDPTIEADPASGALTCSLKIIDEWKDFDRTNGRRTNDGEQQRLFPGDGIFRYAHNVTAPVFWGRRQTDRNTSKVRPR